MISAFFRSLKAELFGLAIDTDAPERHGCVDAAGESLN